MKVVFAPDSYKGSLSSMEVAETMDKAFQSVNPQVETILKPMADGGEGTLGAFSKAVSHEKVHFSCTGPMGESRDSWYLILDRNRAVIEGAVIAGLPLVAEEKRNPDNTTSYGIGEAIKHALDHGCTDILVAIGGSSTNDGGLGMLQALGMKAYSQDGKEADIYGRDVHSIKAIDFSTLDHRLEEVTIRVASDVDNPLTGKNGASYVYGPQKGATEAQVVTYDHALENYGKLVEIACGKSIMEVPGAGAAGGLGFAFLSIGATLQSGAKLVAEAIHLDEDIQQADYVITGEGQSDAQTLFGKAPGYVADLANKYKKPVILISGGLGEEYTQLNTVFTSCFSITPAPTLLEDSLKNAEDYLFQTTVQIARLLSI
ncbi:glycerate kinase [Halobacillus karajensis]|uniref:glycerate kinase n=1 Tax=Halobacillus karajensis TaxID=195088 RepID=UPI0008A73BD0|nr:glycerate kinase [Halobacillus karajensis]SEH41046.1 glycerate kinase [Halobacillus karajensis]